MRTRFERAAKRGLLAVLAATAAVAVLAAIAGSAAAQLAITEWGVPTPNSQPSNLAAGASGDLWFGELSGNKIARISPTGVFQEFPVPTLNSQPWGLAVDPNGKVWFTEATGNKIGNLAPNGVFGQDNIPTDNSQPRGMVLDGAGNLWFVESRGNKIGKFVPSSSQFTEYDVPTAASQPWAVALDGSGNLWFTERAGNKLGRMSPSGQFNEYGVPTPGSAPAGIAVDASGNVWFTEYDGNKIGRMAPGGVFTEYSLPTSGTRPHGIAIDRTGAVWYAGTGSGSFGRVSGGSIVEYGLPTPNGAPFGIVVDAAGSVWLTEQESNRIARAGGMAAAPAPTPTPAAPIPAPTPAPAPRDARYFGATGFRIDNDVFWGYFQRRGGLYSFGYPVSRTFILLGFSTQFFQREIVQLGPDGSARTMNLLDPGLMPYTRINGSSFPAPDPALAVLAPVPGTQGYDDRVQQFVRSYAPDRFEGMSANFYQAFVNTVTLRNAFPQGQGNASLLPLLNLEIWGVPTSRPQRDPNNGNFVYLRFQRGIMHYDASGGATQGLLLADYLKSILTGWSLPADLDGQASGSQFYHQYNPSKPNWVDRPDLLPGTNLSYAFERQ